MRRCRIKFPNRCYHLVSRVARRYRASFLRRMWNASEFMKTLKQHYTMSFNGRRGHHGTMWESRYRVRVRDPGECGMMLAESGYVDANPVNAGMADWPDGYEWCSYAAGLETPGYISQVVAKGDNVRAVRLMQLLQWEPKSPAYLWQSSLTLLVRQ